MTTEILQRKYIDNSVTNIVGKLNNTVITLNTELIHRDIKKFSEMLKKAKDRYNRENIKAINNYLRELVKTLRPDESLELTWSIDRKTGFPKSYPIRLVCEDLYGVNVCNYIELDKENKFIDIDLSKLANAIAFELMCRDLGENHESIEEALKNCGVTTVENIEVLENYYKKVCNGSSPYELSKTMQIEDSPYYLREENLIQDYFGCKTFKPKQYNDVVKYSCEYASSIILGNVFREANRTKSNFRLLSIDATRIQFEIKECSDKYIRETLIGDIIIRILGRKFKLSNHVTIY